jgi:hypothetical protein
MPQKNLKLQNHICRSQLSTLTFTTMHATRPNRRQSVTDTFFFHELRSALGHAEAERWLATASPPCTLSRTASPACSGPTTPRTSRGDASPRHLDCAPRDQSNEHECVFQRLMHEHGEKVGLLFTDAAHELLDSPLSVARDFSAREHFL